MDIALENRIACSLSACLLWQYVQVMLILSGCLLPEPLGKSSLWWISLQLEVKPLKQSQTSRIFPSVSSGSFNIHTAFDSDSLVIVCFEMMSICIVNSRSFKVMRKGAPLRPFRKQIGGQVPRRAPWSEVKTHDAQGTRHGKSLSASWWGSWGFPNLWLVKRLAKIHLYLWIRRTPHDLGNFLTLRAKVEVYTYCCYHMDYYYYYYCDYETVNGSVHDIGMALSHQWFDASARIVLQLPFILANIPWLKRHCCYHQFLCLDICIVKASKRWLHDLDLNADQFPRRSSTQPYFRSVHYHTIHSSTALGEKNVWSVLRVLLTAPTHCPMPETCHLRAPLRVWDFGLQSSCVSWRARPNPWMPLPRLQLFIFSDSFNSVSCHFQHRTCSQDTPSSPTFKDGCGNPSSFLSVSGHSVASVGHAQDHCCLQQSHLLLCFFEPFERKMVDS